MHLFTSADQIHVEMDIKDKGQAELDKQSIYTYSHTPSKS